MTYDQLCNLYAQSVTLRILRARSAPMMLSFFHYTFKEKNQTTISNVELVTRLSDYLGVTGYRAADDEIDAGSLLEHDDEKARKYIEQWSNKGFLRKYPDDDGVDIHELSSDMEKVMHWVSTLQKREFVGTESRFKDIFSKLKELIDQSNKDPAQRIQELEKKKYEIEQEIKTITITGKVQVFDDTQIKERFYDVNRMSRELLSDFKEVEQNFEQITRRFTANKASGILPKERCWPIRWILLKRCAKKIREKAFIPSGSSSWMKTNRRKCSSSSKNCIHCWKNATSNTKMTAFLKS